MYILGYYVNIGLLWTTC